MQMADENTKKGFLDSLLIKGKEFLESDQLKKFGEDSKSVIKKSVDAVKEVDIKDLSNRWKKAISKAVDFVEDFDAKQTVDDIKQVWKDFNEDPDKAIDSTIEKFIRFVARTAGMPDPKTGEGKENWNTGPSSPSQ